ncbi:hypothetical protein CU669_02595 [Paramagnetospirillum kuznetsovii]|uniref:DUF4337 domain-containing protein n=1 Tax=Paramagnetospirillum kuznetsovii TaxID=2053833 RepID=A0A364P3S8_9PROT|nr:DUF4337 domain-containing protein [Paramagnetospirillum kuznetsovii]RAU23974.1 hypothetical protein CU669_02595 [Paramagnetospirillum kuznetsovii]
MEAHETHETIHHTAHHGHGHGNDHDEGKTSRNKKIAVLISVLAMLLAIIEAGGKSAQNTSLAANIHANDLWAFYQAKHIRSTMLRTSADALELSAPASEAVTKKVADWRATAQRYDSEPESGEGRKELAAKAKAEEAHRDYALSAYHLFEYGAAALQIAIVLASASVVTGMLVLSFVAGGLGAVGIAFGLLGWLAPTLIHL